MKASLKNVQSNYQVKKLLKIILILVLHARFKVVEIIHIKSSLKATNQI